MTIEYRPNPVDSEKLYGPSTAFKLRYEFVDTSLGGAPLEPLPAPSAMPEPAALIQSQIKSCDRVYRYDILASLIIIIISRFSTFLFLIQKIICTFIN